MSDVIITATIDANRIADNIMSAFDDKAMLTIHNLLAKMCNPYVPMAEGPLSQTLNITPEYVAYLQPYAHYQYVGQVYGPNFKIYDADGNFIGWRSPSGKGYKHPTERALNYRVDKHPLATKEWDKAMMRDCGNEFLEQVKAIAVRRAKELYGY